MVEHLLPDEIISEILSPALKVSDSDFSNTTSDVSPFANYSESSSAYLLVCKSWLRVATPLLYYVVVLRSKAQAKALSVSLSTNKELGQFIKKLRVEGGYGLPMHTILRCSPNISDLFLTLEIYSSDNTSGLCKGLRLINPTRLILRDLSKPLKNKMTAQLVEALSQVISKWDCLCVFDCPFNDGTGLYVTKIIQPLVKCKRLHTLVVPTPYDVSWAYVEFRDCPLKVIEIKRQVTRFERSHLEKDPVSMKLLKFIESSAASELPLITPSLNPAFIPMTSAPKEIQAKIWGRVLYFAMRVPELANNPLRSARGRLAPLLVSKSFNQLGLPHYYAHVVLWNSQAVTKFAPVLLKNPSIGPCVRSLVMRYWEPRFQTSGAHSAMLTVLSLTTRLVRLSQTLRSDFVQEGTIPWSAFEAVAERTSFALREFSLRIATIEATSPAIFTKFATLQTLEWKSGTSFLLTDIPVDALQNLEELRISFATPSFLVMMCKMKLKSLRRVVLSGNLPNPEIFLKVHGSKLAELDVQHRNLGSLKAKIFELCPNLCTISLIVQDHPPAIGDLYSPHAAIPSLVKIHFTLPLWDDREKDSFAAWENFFRKVEPSGLPNLREIHVDCFTWPKNEREIAKSCWVPWAEILFKRRIDLTDRTGAKWRPRLKVK